MQYSSVMSEGVSTKLTQTINTGILIAGTYSRKNNISNNIAGTDMDTLLKVPFMYIYKL